MAGQILWGAWAWLDGALRRDAGVYVEGTAISATGAYADLVRRYPDAAVVGGEGCFVLPGLINILVHGRALGTVALGVPDSFLEVWLTYLAMVPQLPPRLAAAYEGLQLIRSGVTAAAHSHNPASFEGMFDEARETLAGYRDAGVRVAMHPPVMDQNRLIYDERERFLGGVPPHLQAAAQQAMQIPSTSTDDYFRGMDDLYAQHHDAQHHWAHIQISPVVAPWASDALILRCADWAREHDTRIQMHMLETPYQRQYAFRRWNKGFIAHLDEIGALSDRLTLAHMVWVEDSDAALLAARGVGVAHNASSNLRLRSGIAPVAALLNAGVRVGIGLDGHGLDDDQDYLREMRLAFTLANRPGARSADVSPLTVLEMGTRLGAEITFGAHTALGVLAAGRLADVVLLDWNAVKGAWCPPGFPAEAHVPEFLLRRAARAHVRDVMVHGEWFVREGRHTRLDEAEISRAVCEAYAAQPPPERGELDRFVRQHYAAWDEPQRAQHL